MKIHSEPTSSSIVSPSEDYKVFEGGMVREFRYRSQAVSEFFPFWSSDEQNYIILAPWRKFFPPELCPPNGLVRTRDYSIFVHNLDFCQNEEKRRERFSLVCQWILQGVEMTPSLEKNHSFSLPQVASLISSSSKGNDSEKECPWSWSLNSLKMIWPQASISLEKLWSLLNEYEFQPGEKKIRDLVAILEAFKEAAFFHQLQEDYELIHQFQHYLFETDVRLVQQHSSNHLLPFLLENYRKHFPNEIPFFSFDELIVIMRKLFPLSWKPHPVRTNFQLPSDQSKRLKQGLTTDYQWSLFSQPTTDSVPELKPKRTPRVKQERNQGNSFDYVLGSSTLGKIIFHPYSTSKSKTKNLDGALYQLAKSKILLDFSLKKGSYNTDLLFSQGQILTCQPFNLYQIDFRKPNWVKYLTDLEIKLKEEQDESLNFLLKNDSDLLSMIRFDRPSTPSQGPVLFPQDKIYLREWLTTSEKGPRRLVELDKQIVSDDGISFPLYRIQNLTEIPTYEVKHLDLGTKQGFDDEKKVFNLQPLRLLENGLLLIEPPEQPLIRGSKYLCSNYHPPSSDERKGGEDRLLQVHRWLKELAAFHGQPLLDWLTKLVQKSSSHFPTLVIEGDESNYLCRLITKLNQVLHSFLTIDLWGKSNSVFHFPLTSNLERKKVIFRIGGVEHSTKEESFLIIDKFSPLIKENKIINDGDFTYLCLQALSLM